MTANTTPSPRVGKLMMQMLVGALFGAATMVLLLKGIGKETLRQAGPDEFAAFGVGVVYCLIGLFVGWGTLFPKAGAKVLNVHSEEEIEDERHMLGWSSAAMLLIGFVPLILAFASPGFAYLSPTVAAVGFAICVIGQIAIGYITRNDADEFARRMSLDTATVFLTLMSVVFGTWAAFAHLGFVAMFSGLAFVAGTLALFLLSIFWVTGRRGLLMPS